MVETFDEVSEFTPKYTAIQIKKACITLINVQNESVDIFINSYQIVRAYRNG